MQNSSILISSWGESRRSHLRKLGLKGVYYHNLRERQE
jgi:hypothetical protein